MPRRLIQVGGQRWTVAAAAEQRPSSRQWHLVFSYRAAGAGPGQTAVWASYPFESASKAALFARAERIPDDELVALLAEKLGAAHQAS